ncbi:AAA family ATPase [Roseicyclus persicicus]|uniref:ATP-binding protein n=1 Tax=Roseicyclus persicicus TaxID=2650661 RepID=A0A7X6H1W8_9RHOB|nr:AAA family ATPase [Roseibacterium persicicum]NKX46430.1 ATP-binding protein [Roseibacterium persicicum]
MTAPRLIYVGGARGAGKSVAAARLGARLGRAVVRIDRYYVACLRAARDPAVALAAAEEIARRLVDDLVAARASAVIEGAWLRPDEAQALRAAHGVAPVFLGYPDACAATRLAAFRAGVDVALHGRLHDLADRPDAEALALIEAEMAQGRWQRDACAQLGLPFVDTTDFAAAEAVLDALFPAGADPGQRG